MSERDDALRDMAANRGCKLVKSRKRKPGGDFGRYGLKDARTGREVLGFGADGLTATAEEVEAYLRGGLKASWKRSLIAAVPSEPTPSPAPARAEAPRRRKPSTPRPQSKQKAPSPPSSVPRKVEPKASPPARKASVPKIEPPKVPVVREAKPGDAAALAELIVELGYDVAEADVRRRLAELRKRGEPPLVAELEGVAGCLTWHVRLLLHRPWPVGRISMLVISEKVRGQGIGSMLVAAAEERMKREGCGLVEVTSNMKRMRAHAFYQRLGYERTSYRFAKTLE